MWPWLNRTCLLYTSFFDYPGEFCIIRDWLASDYVRLYNSSVFRLEIGSKTDVYNKFLLTSQQIISSCPGDQQDVYKRQE